MIYNITKYKFWYNVNDLKYLLLKFTNSINFKNVFTIVI